MRRTRVGAERGNAAVWVLIVGVVVMAAMVGLMSWWTGDRAAGGGADLPPPEFRLASIDGGELGPPDYRGQVVVVDFWATWCGPCHLQADILEPLHAEYGPRGVQFLAVSLGEDEAVVRSFVERDPYPYPVLLDPEDRVSQEYGIYALPTIMVLDREGNVTYFQPGVSGEKQLREVLERSLAA